MSAYSARSPARRFTWLHLSDWHQGREDFNRQVVAEALIKDLKKRDEWAAGVDRVDAVFFTGDLAFKGLRAEFDLAADLLLVPVLGELELGRERLFLVPGNHDIDRTRFKFLPQALLSPFSSEAEASEWFADDETTGTLLKPFRDYEAFIRDFNPGGFTGLADSRVLDIGNVRVALSGINSALMCGRHKDLKGEVDDYGKLTIGERQIYRPLESIQDVDLLIGLVHHPFAWLAGDDQRAVKGRMLEALDYLLFGHEHTPDFRKEVGHSVTCTLIPAGAAFERRVAANPVFANSYNLVTLDLDSRKGKIHMRRWAANNREWKRDDEFGNSGVHAFKLSGPPKALNPQKAPDTTVAERRYCEFVRRQCQHVESKGILQTNTLVTLPLDEVYVSLDALRDPSGGLFVDPRIDWESDEGKAKSTKEEGPRDDERAKEQEKARSTVPPPVRVDLPTAIRDSKRLVVLGDPGAGKTTLTRFLANLFSRCLLDASGSTADRDGNQYGPPLLPIWVRAANYAESRVGKPGLSFKEFLIDSVAESGIARRDAQRLVDSVLQSDKVLILVDGLDESGDGAQRAKVVQALNTFGIGVGQNTRIVVTSRVAGYAEVQLPADFDRYTLRELDRHQIARFLWRWCLAVEEFYRRNSTQSEIMAAAQREVNGLLAAVDGAMGVKRLAGNPLLLTILALIHRQGQRLPSRRVKLYELASQTLLREWRRNQVARGQCEVTEWEEEALLAPLAWHMHEEYASGEIPHEEARRLLIGQLAKERGATVGNADLAKHVDEFLDRIRRQAGMISERRPGFYRFLHLTFEEYFAARHMVGDPVQAVELIRQRRHRARWEEPIRLAIAMQSAELASRLIRSGILGEIVESYSRSNEPSPYEEILCRDLFLAVRCYSDAVGATPDLVVHLADRILLAVVGEAQEPRPFAFADEVRAQLGCFIDTSAEHRVIAGLISASQREFWDRRYQAALALGAVSDQNQDARNALIRLAKDEYVAVRQAAAQALGVVADHNQDARNALIRLATDGDMNVRRAVTQTLGSLADHDQGARNALIRLAKDEAWHVRQASAQALGVLADKNQDAGEALLRLAKDGDENVRRAVAQSLGALADHNQDAWGALLRLAEDEHGNVCQAAAQALGVIADQNQDARNVLIRLAKDDVWHVRQAAAQALGAVADKNQDARNALIMLAKDDSRHVLQAVAQALGVFADQNQDARNALIRLAEDETWFVRQASAQALGGIADKNQDARTVLIMLAKDEAWYVRQTSAQALGAVADKNQDARNALIMLAEDEVWHVRQTSAQALGAVADKNQDAGEALLRLAKDGDENVRRAVAQSLGALADHNQDAWGALLRLAEDEHGKVRQAVAQALGAFADKNQDAKNALIMLAKDQDRYVRQDAAQAIGVIAARESGS